MDNKKHFLSASFILPYSSAKKKVVKCINIYFCITKIVELKEKKHGRT